MKRRTLLALPALLSVASCVPNTQGGYAAQCRLPKVDGWEGQLGDYLYVKELPQGRLEVRTSHLDTASEPGTLIELNALVTPAERPGRYPELLFDPKTAWLVAGDRVLHPEPTLRESPLMRDHWRFGGTVAVPADMDRAWQVVLTFRDRVSPRESFVLHLGQFVVDGKPLAIPDLPYCYLPSKTTWAPFHG